MALQDYLYSMHTVPEVLERYIKDLTETGEIQSIIHANKLMSYSGTIIDKQFQKDLRTLFNETYTLLTQSHPHLNFSIAGRRKSLISTEKKILQYLSLGKSLDLIRDFFAFRIILFGDESSNLIQDCYTVMEEIIDFAVKSGFTPCERLPLIGVSDPSKHSNSYFSSFKYKKFVKDYICFPKENGYQSIHLVLVDTKGRHLEVQIRTLDMHACIESGDSNHSDYKKNKYNLEFPIQREKISIRGYAYLNDCVYDYAGVEYPITIFQRQTTF